MELLDAAVNSVQKKVTEKIDEGASSIKNEMTMEAIETPTIDLKTNIADNIDLSELKNQGIDTSEIEKSLSEAQAQLNTQDLDINSINSGFDITGEIDNYANEAKTKINDIAEAAKDPKDLIEKVKNEMGPKIETMKNVSETNAIDVAEKAISRVESKISSAMSKVSSSTGYSFGGFGRRR